ncbi:alpha/beta fold hydrolase [Pararhizobium gei]|uniref:alpha/beta fold hydrolase n=1 Tax=Pararhizobium gei TaxID=1395951 RepID=UPI0023DA6181|nr:alpha/beta hydrolase [Rhizobium gei]
MFEKVERLRSPSGAVLAWRCQPASAPEKAVLLISHGLSEHAGRYQPFASFMAARGCHVYAHDHRGHGETVANDAPLGQFARKDGVAAVLVDLKAVRDMATARHPGLPIVLFGHSMGGLIAMNAGEEHPELYDGLAIWNANFNPGLAGRAAQGILAVEKMLKGSDVPSGFLPRLTFGAWANAVENPATPFDWLSHDPAEVQKYVDDPLCGFEVSISLWIDLFDLAFRAPRLDRLRRLPRSLPIHLVGGGEDPATNGGREILWLEKRMGIAGLKRIDAVIYPQMRHETLNEVERDTAMQGFADWCLAVVKTEDRFESRP